MKRLIIAIFLTIGSVPSIVSPPVAFAQLEKASETFTSLLTYEEFKAIAEELASRVNLFAAAWEVNASAEFFGGTTRDFLFWVKGRFRGLRTRSEVLKKMAELRALPLIDVRDFLTGESDVDIVASAGLPIRAEDFGVRKIDAIDTQRFDVKTPLGQTELLQGYLPVEKIRLGKSGFIAWPGFGDCVREIYTGVLSAHFPDRAEFRRTHYAAQKLNHEILLALRYVRSLAINYFQDYGRGYPERPALFGSADPASLAAVKQVIARVLEKDELSEYFAQERFRRWFNDTVRKAFRSNTNPTATRELFRDLRLDEVVERYRPHADPINQYLFSRPALDPAERTARLAAFGAQESTFYANLSRELPDHSLYHGTREESAFRAIILQGVFPSERGDADEGLYAVPLSEIRFAEAWGKSKDRVVKFRVKDDARIVDITRGEGQRVFREFGKSYSEFAEYFGIDILRYPYNVTAYIVKNASALESPEGVYRQIMSFAMLLEQARRDQFAILSDPRRLQAVVGLNQMTSREISAFVNEAMLSANVDIQHLLGEAQADLQALLQARPDKLPSAPMLSVWLMTEGLRTRPETVSLMQALVAQSKLDAFTVHFLADFSDAHPEWAQAVLSRLTPWTAEAFIVHVLSKAWRQHPEWVPLALSKGADLSLKAFVQFVLPYAASAHPEWLELAIRNNRMNNELNQYVLSRPDVLADPTIAAMLREGEMLMGGGKGMPSVYLFYYFSQRDRGKRSKFRNCVQNLLGV